MSDRPEISRVLIPKPVLARMPRYLHYLRAKYAMGYKRISSTVISADLNLNPVQVRKDLAYINDSGKPRTGFDTSALIYDIEQYLGYDRTKNAVLVGVGHLGQALLAYDGFDGYGLDIKAAFDVSPEIIGKTIRNTPVCGMDALAEMIAREDIHIAIITVPAGQAQSVCDSLILSGITAIWNFAPVYLEAPPEVIVQNEDIAASLAFLSNQLKLRGT